MKFIEPPLPLNDSEQAASKKLFNSFFSSVFFVVLFYVIFYWQMKALTSSMVLFVGLIFFVPLIKWTSHKGHEIFARSAFVISCNYYIFFASMGLNHNVHAEYFCLSLALMVLLLFESGKTRQIISGVASSFITWILIDNKIAFTFSRANVDTMFDFGFLARINFIGAFLIMTIFIVIFIRISKKRVQYEIDLLIKSKIDQELLAQERIKVAHSAKLAAIGEISAGVAHEINNPLATILSSIALLRKSAYDQQLFDSMIDVMHRSSERIAKIVLGLKNFSRRADLDSYTPQNLSIIVMETKVLSEIKAKQFSVELKVKLSGDSKIACNEGEIVQVLMNLISNGIDAAKNSDEKWVEILVFEKKTKVIVQVINSGATIPTELVDKIFQPFFTTKIVGQGTGLGLSISKSILEQHDASLKLNQNMMNTCFEMQFNKYLENKSLN